MNSIEYATPSSTFKNALNQVPKNYQYVIVFHFSHNNLAYLLEWLRAVPVLGVISIPYSENPDVKAEVSKYTTVYSPALDQIPNCIIDICSKHIDTEIVLIEIGGYSAAISAYLPNIVLAVEDTTRGHERYKEHANSLTYPVVSVARTKGKQQEDGPVGQAIAESTKRVIDMFGVQLEQVITGVMGYGGVGRATANHLKQLWARVDVYDPDPQRMTLAKQDGFIGNDRQTLLANADVIVGCSGYESIHIEDLPNLKNDVLLISGSSRQVEFPYAALEKLALDSAVDGIIEEFTVHEKSLKLIYKAQPINFYFDISLGDVFDIPMTLLAQAVTYGLSQQLPPGLHELPEK